MAAANSIPSNNNLDLVRFFLASMVFVSHAQDLSNLPALAFLPSIISSTLAVQAFFAISGFLIFQSYDRSSSLASYADKRVRRIYPAYVVVVVLCAIGLSFVSALPPSAYFADIGVWRYVGANLIFMNFLAPDLPGVFSNNTLHAINGSLWTLKIEVAFYVAVPICGWLIRRIGCGLVLISVYLASVLFGVCMLRLAASRPNGGAVELAHQLPGQMTYFIAGAAIYYNFSKFRTKPLFAFVLGLIVYLCSWLALEPVLRPIGIALCVMSIAFGPYLGRFGRHGDYSYGIYIVHFPILQLMISFAIPQKSLLLFLGFSAALVLLAAVLMWHIVEKRFLRRDSHYWQKTQLKSTAAPLPVILSG